MTDPGPYRRRSASVLLLDGAGRTLLLRSYNDARKPRLGHSWHTPGGGVDDGEPLAEAAVRELSEEVGLVVDVHALGTQVAFTTGYADLGWGRVDRHNVDTRGLNQLERKHHTGHRWWTLDELAATTETIYPFGLISIVADLLAGRVPASPIELPWHH